MLLNGLNSVSGTPVRLAMLSLNLQVELLFINGSPGGIITHYDKMVYLNKVHLNLFEEIQAELWTRVKGLYKCQELVHAQEMGLHLRTGWAIQRLADQMEIILGHVTEAERATVIKRKEGRFVGERVSRLCPVVIHDYDEPYDLMTYQGYKCSDMDDMVNDPEEPYATDKLEDGERVCDHVYRITDL